MVKPLGDMASDLGVAVVLVTHMRKGQTGKSLHNTMGSLAFTAAARVVLMVMRDPNESEQRILVTVKSNMANDKKGFTYKIIDGKVEWTGTIDATADDVLSEAAATNRSGGRPRDPALVAAGEKIREALEKAPGKCLPSAEIKALVGNMEGVTWRQVTETRFKQAAGIKAIGAGPGALWALADSE